MPDLTHRPGRRPGPRPQRAGTRSLLERVAEAMRLTHHRVVAIGFADAEPDIRAHWLGEARRLLAELGCDGVAVTLTRPAPEVSKPSPARAGRLALAPMEHADA